MCESILKLGDSPSRSLCNAFPTRHFPLVIGSKCDQECVFGRSDSKTKTCTCWPGYWGDQCDKECTGGSQNACSKHGTCNTVTGNCNCDRNWKGENCESCAEGWTGKDCSLLEPTIPDDIPLICTSLRNGMIMNFEGFGVTVNRPGTYNLVMRRNFSIQARHVSCGRKLCVDSVAIQLQEHSVVVNLKGKRNTELFINGQQRIPLESIHLASKSRCGVIVTHKSATVYIITVADIHLEIKINVVTRHLTTIFEIPNDVCCNINIQSGLCGRCDSCKDVPLQSVCDFGTFAATSATGYISSKDDQETIEKEILKDRLKKGESILETTKIDNKYISDIGSDTAVCFNDSSIIANLGQLIGNSHVTIEFYIKTCAQPSCYGTILSYAWRQSFTVVYDGTLIVTSGNQKWNTSLSLEDDVWNQVSLVYNDISSVLDVYVFNRAGTTQRFTASLPDIPFHSGGNLVLGRGQPVSKEVLYKPSFKFVGCIDEFRIWKKYFDSVEIQQHWNRTYSSKDEGLVCYWPFQAPEDDIFTDEISLVAFQIPKAPFRRSEITLSEAPVPFKKENDLRGMHPTISRKKRDASGKIPTKSMLKRNVFDTSLCKKIFIDSEMASLCSSVTASLIQLNYQDCVYNARFVGNLQNVADSVMNLADYCQLLLNTTKWPGQELCNYFGNTVQYRIWIGQKCNKTCFFGSKSSSDGNKCQCLTGYWKENCSAECPGSVSNPCSGYGSCDQITGICNCPVQFQGNCSICKDGWFGANCTIAYQNNANHSRILAAMSPLGHGQSVEGANFELKETGSYNLLSVTDNLIVQGRFVKCHENYVCLSLLGLSIGDPASGYANITIHAANLKNKGPLIYVNGQLESLDNPLYFSGFKVSRSFQNRIKIETDFNATLSVVSENIFLRFQITMDSELKEYSTGLLGSTHPDDNTSSIMNMYFPHKNLHNFYNFCSTRSKTQIAKVTPQNTTRTPLRRLKTSWILKDKTTDNSKRFQHFKVDPCDKIFYPDTYYTRQTGYSLKFNDTVVYTPVRSDMFHPNITVDFFVKVLSETGILFAYTNNHSLSLFYNRTVKIIIDDQQIETNLTLTRNKWNKIVFVYSGNKGLCDIYVFAMSGNVVRYTGFIRPNLFKEPGYLSVGQWLPPFGKPNLTYLPNLKAEIENFLVWDLLLKPNIIMESWNMDPVTVKNLLSAAWLFDEGTGGKASDFVRGREFRTPGQIWNDPEWVASDLRKITDNSVRYLNYTFTSELLRESAEEYCSVIYELELSGLCLPISHAVADFYYISCIQFASMMRYVGAGRSQVYQFAELCQTSSGLSLTKFLNSKYEDKNSLCHFGSWTFENSSCVCNYGYFGNTCKDVCPGGSQNPCSGHGFCDQNGTCACKWNSDGKDCSRCRHGMTGSNCSVAYTLPLSNSRGKIAMAFSTGQYLRFDGKAFDLPKETGVFRLFFYEKMDVHIHQALCQHGSCINAFAVSVDKTILTLYPTGNDDHLEIFVNGTRLKPDQLQKNISNLSLTIKSNFELYISLLQPKILTFKILIQAVYMSISVYSDPVICKQAVGLLGSCDLTSPGFDFGSSTDVQLLQYFRQYKILETNSLFLKDRRSLASPFSAGYALFFNSTAALSQPIKVDQQTHRNSSGHSISFLVKPFTHSGTLISFGNQKSFAVFNTNPIRVACGRQNQDTKAVNVLNEWNQIILVFDKHAPKVHFYHFGPDKKITYNILKLTCPDIYEKENVISLGAWHPSFQSSKFSLTNSSFTGLLDEITIWSVPLSISTIYQTFHLNTKISRFGTQLDFLFKFSEGHGYRTQDSKSGNSIFLPAYPWQAPVWVYSDVSLYSLRKTYGDKNSIQPSFKMVKTCNDFFESELLQANCPKITAVFLKTFSHLCAFHSTISPESIYLSVSSIGEMCVSLGGKRDEIKGLICRTKIPRPDWLDLMCRNCHFGRLQDNGNCVCDSGYWGNTCDKMCPNGALKPCSLHGSCDTDGQCVCYGQWAGEKCDHCLSGWIGPSCAIMKRNSSPRITQLTAFIDNTRIKTFDLVSFDINTAGQYKLLTIRPEDLTLYGQFVKCGQSDLCYVSLLIKDVGIKLFINETSFTAQKITVWDGHYNIDLYRIRSYKNIQFTRLTKKSFQIFFPRQEMTVNVELDSQLSVMLSTTLDAKPRLTSGLLTSCNTIREISYGHCNINKSSICDSTVTVSCNEDLSSKSIGQYIKTFLVSPSSGQTNSSPSMDGCLFYHNNTGMYIKNLTLFNEFTLEFHVNPSKYEGVIFSFVTLKNHLLLLNAKYGLKIISDGSFIDSGISLELNSWNQVDLAWNSAISSLEIYVIYNSGSTMVKAVRISSDTFTDNGKFIIGSSGKYLQDKYNIPDGFTGYIDEVRIWKRPHNPTIITRNWRMKVSRATPDLAMSWNFNKMAEIFAKDLKQGVVMYPLRLSRAPTWRPSTLILKREPEIDFITELSVAANNSLVKEARKLCKSIFNDTLMDYCLALGDDLVTSYHQECIKEVVVSQNPTKSARSALMFAKECQTTVNSTNKNPVELVCEHLESKHIVLSSPDCQGDCLFGALNTTGSCVCSEGFFGDNCDQVCPIAAQGVCNLKGTCSSTTKSCECSSHWLGMSQDLISYWRGFLSNSTTYPCNICSSGWAGSDCNILQVDNIGNNKTTKKSVAVAFGSNVITFDGVAYTMITVGSYQLVETEEITVEGYFVPCRNNYLCRTLASVSFILDRSTTLLVKQIRDYLVLTLIKEGKETNIEYPTNQGIGTNTKILKVLWTQRQLLRITVGDIKMLVSLVDSEMFVGVFLSESGRKMRGLFGNNDGNQGNDISERPVKNISLSDEPFSLETIGRFVKRNFKIHLQQTLTNSGYKVTFSKNFAHASDLLLTNLPKITVGFWIQFKTEPNTNVPFISFSTNKGEIQLGILKNFLFLKHFKTFHTTDLHIELNTWLYIVFVWHNKDPNTMLYLFSQSNLQYFQYKNDHIGSILDLTEIKITSHQTRFELDYLRLWNSTHSLNDIYKHYNVYTDKFSDQQLLHVLFDEGEGLTSYVHSTSGGKLRQTRLIFGPDTLEPEWQPSDLPVLEEYSAPDMQVYTLEHSATKTCLAVLEDPVFESACKPLLQSKQFFVENCIRMSRLRAPVGNLTRSLYAFYCKERLDINSCSFKGFLDFCNEEETKLSVAILVIITFCILILCGVVIYCICRKLCAAKHSECCVCCVGIGKSRDSFSDRDAHMSVKVRNPVWVRGSSLSTDTDINFVQTRYEDNWEDSDTEILTADYHGPESDYTYDNPAQNISDNEEPVPDYESDNPVRIETREEDNLPFGSSRTTVL